MDISYEEIENKYLKLDNGKIITFNEIINKFNNLIKYIDIDIEVDNIEGNILFISAIYEYAHYRLPIYKRFMSENLDEYIERLSLSIVRNIASSYFLKNNLKGHLL